MECPSVRFKRDEESGEEEHILSYCSFGMYVHFAPSTFRNVDTIYELGKDK